MQSACKIAWAQPVATLANYKRNLQTWQAWAEKLKKKGKKNSEWSSGVESGVNFRAALQICARASPLCLSPCPLTWVKGAFRGAAELFKSCVWVLVWKSGSAEGARGRFTPHDQERWRPFPRQPIFPSLPPPHPTSRSGSVGVGPV